MKKYVLFIDICSSTRIMENLKNNDNEDKFEALVRNVYQLLEVFKDEHKAFIYKFMGDGFIVLFNDNDHVDGVLDYIIKAISNINTIVDTFFDLYIDYDIEKKGVTGGLAYGNINECIINGSKEYFGRPLNLAARLQASNEIANSVLIQKEVYGRISKYGPKIACKETSRTFKNIDNTNKIRCYSFFPQAIDGLHIEDLASEIDYIKMERNERLSYDDQYIKLIKNQMEQIAKYTGLTKKK